MVLKKIKKLKNCPRIVKNIHQKKTLESMLKISYDDKIYKFLPMLLLVIQIFLPNIYFYILYIVSPF